MAVPTTTHAPKPFTYADLAAMPDDGYRREIIGGSLIVTPAPSSGHQWASVVLCNALFTAAPPSARVLAVPCDWNLPSGDNVEPDLLVIDRADFNPTGAVPASATPLLVVEILSPSNANQDLLIKRALYASLGVPSYWIVDPRVPSLLALRLAGSGDVARYDVEAEVTGDEAFVTERPFPTGVVPTDLTR